MKVIEFQDRYSKHPEEWKEMDRFETYGAFRSRFGKSLAEARSMYGYYRVRAWQISPGIKMLIEGEGAVPHFEWV